MDYYEILGVDKNATQEEIKKAYRKKARKLHPDVAGVEKEEEFKNVTVAYETLSHPDKRRTYDMGGADAFSAGFGSSGFANFNDIFDTFGSFDSFFSSGASQSSRRASRQQRGNDRLINVSLDLKEIAFGTEKEIIFDTFEVCNHCSGEGTNEPTKECSQCKGTGHIQKVMQSLLGQIMTSVSCPTCNGYGSVIVSKCEHCSGQGRIKTEKNLKVTIPSGVEDGSRIRIALAADAGLFGGPSGDLYIQIQQKHHDTFLRDGNDLHTKIKIPITAAVLGTQFEIQTLDGAEKITVPAGTQPGDKITLKEKGIGRLKGTGRGNLYIHVDIEVPKKIDAEQKKLFEQIANLRGEQIVEPKIDTNQQGFFSKLREKLDL